jgi:biotin operon repressor
MKPYNREEKELLESIEQENWVSVENLEEEIKTTRERVWK